MFFPDINGVEGQVLYVFGNAIIIAILAIMGVVATVWVAYFLFRIYRAICYVLTIFYAKHKNAENPNTLTKACETYKFFTGKGGWIPGSLSNLVPYWNGRHFEWFDFTVKLKDKDVKCGDTLFTALRRKIKKLIRRHKE